MDEERTTRFDEQTYGQPSEPQPQTPYGQPADPYPQAEPYAYNQPEEFYPRANPYGYEQSADPQALYGYGYEQAQNQSGPAGYGPYTPRGGNPRRKKPLLIIAIVVLVLAAVAAALYFFVFRKSESPQKLAEAYAEAMVTGDFQGAAGYLPYDLEDVVEELLDSEESMDEEDIFEMFSQRYDEDIANWKDFYKVAAKARHRDLEDQYGKYTLRIEVTGTEKPDVDSFIEDYEQEETAVEETVDLDLDEITDVRIFTVKVTLDAGVKETVKDEITLIKYKGSWKVCEVDIVNAITRMEY